MAASCDPPHHISRKIWEGKICRHSVKRKEDWKASKASLLSSLHSALPPHTQSRTFTHSSFPVPFVSQNHMLRWALAGTQETRERGEEKKAVAQSPLHCYYTHQTSLIRQQQNFINRMDIIEWACYKWALSGPYSATKWVFSVQCSHLRHRA